MMRKVKEENMTHTRYRMRRISVRDLVAEQPRSLKVFSNSFFSFVYSRLFKGKRLYFMIKFEVESSCEKVLFQKAIFDSGCSHCLVSKEWVRRNLGKGKVRKLEHGYRMATIIEQVKELSSSVVLHLQVARNPVFSMGRLIVF
jgi:hypothetical protein